MSRTSPSPPSAGDPVKCAGLADRIAGWEENLADRIAGWEEDLAEDFADMDIDNDKKVAAMADHAKCVGDARAGHGERVADLNERCTM